MQTSANGALKDALTFSDHSIHELLHTLRLGHPFATTQSQDTELVQGTNGSLSTTSNTDPAILFNIMNYDTTNINGTSYKDLMTPLRQNKLTPGH